MKANRIIVDWGTSSFRAWLIASESDEILDEIKEGLGMSSLTSSEFPKYCLTQLGSWLNDFPSSIYMSGMVGAKQGWQLAPQLDVPLRLQDLSDHMIKVDGMEDTWIIPGARVDAIRPDIMRGEEVQIFGALALAGRENALLCLPGTHSKWANADELVLKHFRTSMTGEVFDVLLSHSIIGLSATASDVTVGSAFDMGLVESTLSGGLLNHLFAIRARELSHNLNPTDVRSFLSGLLIGSEVASMKTLFPPSDQELLLVSKAALRHPYEHALAQAGYKTHWIDARLASLKGICQVIDGRKTS